MDANKRTGEAKAMRQAEASLEKMQIQRDLDEDDG